MTVSFGEGARRVLHAGDPRAEDFEAALERVTNIRSRLTQIRGELEDLGRIESSLESDRMATAVAGTLTLAISYLYGLQKGDRSFGRRAERSRELWCDVAANPASYVIKEGRTWDWRPSRVLGRTASTTSTERGESLADD